MVTIAQREAVPAPVTFPDAGHAANAQGREEFGLRNRQNVKAAVRFCLVREIWNEVEVERPKEQFKSVRSLMVRIKRPAASDTLSPCSQLAAR